MIEPEKTAEEMVAVIRSFVKTHKDKEVIAICVTGHGDIKQDKKDEKSDKYDEKPVKHEYDCILGEDGIPCPVKNILELLNVNSQQPKVDLIFFKINFPICLVDKIVV